MSRSATARQHHQPAARAVTMEDVTGAIEALATSDLKARLARAEAYLADHAWLQGQGGALPYGPGGPAALARLKNMLQDELDARLG